MLRAAADLSGDGNRIEVRFPYSRAGLRAIKSVPGSRWSASKRVWTVSLDLTTARRLREEFGAGLTISPELRRWAKHERARRAMLAQLSQARTAEPRATHRVLPLLDEKLSRRPYQRADARLLALADMINANEPGTGKTFEIIAAVAEAGLLDRPTLTIAPVRSIENTWKEELEKAGYPHTILAIENPPAARRGAINWAWTMAKDGEPFWLVINAEALRVKPGEPAVARDPISGDPYTADQWSERLLDIDWGLVAIDEFQKFGLTNPRSQLGLAARLLKAERRVLSSGTPIGGKYKRMWAALNWLEPEEYGSWWRWAEQWLEISHNGFGKVVKDTVQAGREKEFQHAHAHHFVRRTKLAELPGCPPKVPRLITVGMTKYQEQQYRSFERDAEIRISGRRLSGHGLLAEWSRLKQLANAAGRLEGRKLALLPDSGKLPYLLDALDETGVRKSRPEPRVRAIVGSVSKSFVQITAAFLREHGIEADTLTGDTKDSRPLIRRFEGPSREPYVIVMTIQTGGVSLNLEAAGSIHALDEDWDPDTMTQFFERGDRGSRETPLLCFTYRTRRTIQEYIAEVAAGKEINNRNVYRYRDAVLSRVGAPARPES